MFNGIIPLTQGGVSYSKMMRRKILIGVIFVFMLFLSISFISAQELDESTGIGLDSTFWGLDIALERIRMAFTFGNEAKVNYGLQIAEERLAEIKELINNPVSFENVPTKNRQNELLNQGHKERERVIEQIIDINEEEGNEILKEQMREKIRLQLQKHIDVLTILNLPEQASVGIENAINNSQKAINKIQNYN